VVSKEPHGAGHHFHARDHSQQIACEYSLLSLDLRTIDVVPLAGTLSTPEPVVVVRVHALGRHANRVEQQFERREADDHVVGRASRQQMNRRAFGEKT